MKLSLSNSTRVDVVLLGMARHPSALENTLAMEKGNDDRLEPLPPMGVGSRRPERQTRRNGLGHFTNSPIINKNLDSTGDEVNLLKNGFSEEKQGNELGFVVLLDRASSDRGVLPQRGPTSQDANARVPNATDGRITRSSTSGKLDPPLCVLARHIRIRHPGRKGRVRVLR